MNITDNLARLDPARSISDDIVKSPRAREALAAARSGSTVDEVPSLGLSHATRPTRRRGFKAALVSVPLVAATSLAGVFAFSTAETGAAFAGWQSTPTQPSATVAAQWAKNCGAGNASGVVHGSQGGPREPLTEKIVEQRGNFTYTVLGSSDGWETTCFSQGPVNSPSMSQGFEAPLKQSPDVNGLVTNSVRQIQGDQKDQRWQEVTGKIGRNVTGLEFLAHGTRVKATIKNGFFAAWWPGDQPRLHYGPPNPDVVITLKNGKRITRAIQDFDVSPM